MGAPSHFLFPKMAPKAKKEGEGCGEKLEPFSRDKAEKGRL